MAFSMSRGLSRSGVLDRGRGTVCATGVLFKDPEQWYNSLSNVGSAAVVGKGSTVAEDHSL